MNWLKTPFAKGALAAAFAGGLAAAGVSITDPAHFNIFDHAAAISLGKVFLSGAVGGVILYFQRAPQKPWDGTDRREPDAKP